MPPEIPILFEDEHLWIIHKPAGLLVHAVDDKDARETVVTRLFGKETPSPFDSEQFWRHGVVHRLDQETSGCLIVAKHQECLSRMQDLIRAHQVHKEYRSLSQGTWPEPKFTVQLEIFRNPKNRKKRLCSKQARAGSRTSVSHIEVLEEYAGRLSLLKIVLETGRTHQIRSQLAYFSRPCLGDPLYNNIMKELKPYLKQDVFHAILKLPRQMLHANALRFEHPMKPGSEVQVEAALPDDFQNILKLLKENHC